MKNRLIQLPKESYLLFGARGSGKSTLIRATYPADSCYYIDLLDLRQERKYLRDPQRLHAEVLALPDSINPVIIDEIQKIPALLDVVHSLIESTNKQFVLTGSSARKLKYGHANLLAGRALVRYLFPFSYLELQDNFNLDTALQFGMLPKLYHLNSNEKKAEFLRTYSHLYLKEEIWAEHLIRKLEPFQYFLEIAAQSNGDVINLSNISRDVGVDHKSVSQYFSILEDTLIGLHLPAYKNSFRKRLSQKPKFYFFDPGVVRALSRTLTIPLVSGTYEYGKAFEHFIILECHKRLQYFYPDYRLSYLRSHDGLEVDLVVERPGLPLLMIELKSATDIQKSQLKSLFTVKKELSEKAEYLCFAQVEQALNYDGILVYPWQEGLEKYFPAVI